MNRGWVKDWRKDEDWRFHPLNMRRPFTKYEAFKDLIKLANHEDRRIPFEGGYIKVNRGQHLTSQKKLSERWKWSRSSVSRFLKDLQLNQEISLKSDTLKTVITICNYDRYQSGERLTWNTAGTRGNCE